MPPVEALHVGAAVEVLGDLLPVLAVVQVHGGAELVVLGGGKRDQ